MIGVVKEVKLVDNESDRLYGILVNIKQSTKSSNEITAYPLDSNIKRIPVVGEMVYIVQQQSSDASAIHRTQTYYYVSSVSIQKNINHNALPKANAQFKVSGGGGDSAGYQQAAAGNAESNSTKPFDFGYGFEEVSELSSLQPFSGDVLIEGRFGQSMRMGYTPSNSEGTQNPTWEGAPTSPITILRNTVNESGWNTFVIEDVNEDDSSIYLTSGQKVKLSTPSLGSGLTPPGNYQGAQVIVNSEQVSINSKKDSVILTSAKDIGLSTSDYKVALNSYLDDLLDILETIANGKYPTPVGPTGPLAPAVSKVKALKQKISQ